MTCASPSLVFLLRFVAVPLALSASACGGGAPADSAAAGSGVADSGASKSGADDSGAAGPGAADSGAADSGTAGSGAADSGAADSDAVDSGARESSTADAEGDAATSSDAQVSSNCLNDNPPPGVPFAPGGEMCTLPDGGAGVGAGVYGCVDPAVCQCKSAAGVFQCVQMTPSGGGRAAGVCVYAACSGADEGALCSAQGGGMGTCCAGTCAMVDIRNDRNNCGGCGIVCPDGASCLGGSCDPPCDFGCADGGTCSTCSGGRVCSQAGAVSNVCGGESCTACFAPTCAALADGALCAMNGSSGICCNHTCTSPSSDDRNCGGCGITCCAGTHCSAGAGPISGVCF